ncbi:MAG TPA: MaoC family dehydratase [Chloroflexota bacterium]|nr:MaoC family dehydratase [Chloroflexota bacterium]
MTLDELKAKVGQELGVSAWLTITQEQVNTFADLTGDHQYIHVDPPRAAQTPFGGTIVHGYFTLSLLPGLNEQTIGGPGINLGGRMSVNYGLNRVRFPAPVPVGTPIRLRTALKDVEDVNPGQGPDGKPQAVQVTLTQTIEVQGSEKPAMVAETLTRVYF